MAEALRAFCDGGSAAELDVLPAEARSLFAKAAAATLFQSPGDRTTCVRALKALGLVSDMPVEKYADLTGSPPPLVYTGPPCESAVDRLLFGGAATTPVYASGDLPKIRSALRKRIEAFPEYLPGTGVDERRYVLGGFAAFGNPASFHNPEVRAIRAKAYAATAQVLRALVRTYPDKRFAQGLYLQSLPDRFMLRPAGVQPSAELWHRDVSDQRVAQVQPGDVVLGGWINLDDEPQFFSYVPGSHLGVALHELEEGGFASPFRKLGSELAAASSRLKKLRKEKADTACAERSLAELRAQLRGLKSAFRTAAVKLEIPPGHAAFFPQYVLHEVVNASRPHDQYRLFTGYRLTQSRDYLFPGQRERFRAQDILPLGSGQRPPVYSASHRNYYTDKPFRLWGGKSKNATKRTLLEWSAETFDPVCLLDVPAAPAKGRPRSKIVSRFMRSLKALGLPLYEPYSEAELALNFPRRKLLATDI